MNRTKMVAIIMAVAAFALATGVQAKGPETGTVVVYRAGGIGILVQDGFLLDGQPHNIGFNRRREFVLPAGVHSIARAGVWLRSMDIQSVNVPVNGVVYFQCMEMPFGIVFEVADDQARAKRSAGKCRLQTTE